MVTDLVPHLAAAIVFRCCCHCRSTNHGQSATMRPTTSHHARSQLNFWGFQRDQSNGCRKEDIELRLSTECRLGKLPKAEVNYWLQNTQRINDEVQSTEEKVKKAKYFSRACLGELVIEKIQEVKEHYQIGAFENLVIDGRPVGGLVLPTTQLVGETTAKKTMDEIWGYLMGEEVKKIGVCGMGGAGKTTIITHINNELLKESKKFKNVVWITVSQPFDLVQLQNQIAVALEEIPPTDEDQKIRAGKILKMLENRKFVLILDDVWEAFPLEKVGIPEPTEDNGCKLVITTRSVEICRSMGCKEVNVKPLPNDEALTLFIDKLGDNIKRRPTFEETMRLIVKECAGLPLSIVTVGSCMKGVDDIREWRNALNELSNNIRSAKDSEVLAQLQFSYDRLKDEKVQHCFLYCALYPEDFKISKDELIDYWIAEGLVNEMDSVEATYDKGHSILNKLVNNFLLESGDDDGRCVKMHDLLRDMALHITNKSPLFMTKAGMNLRQLPGAEAWSKNLEKVSLMRNFISEIPSKMSPDCPTLSTLLLQHNPLHSIPAYFFVNMKGLMILDLSYTNIEALPNSISDLRISALLLKSCQRLGRVPSLAKLLSLRNLNLGGTNIKEVPEGMEMLENLRYLNLFMLSLRKLPINRLSQLCRLQKLTVLWRPGKLNLEEAARFNQLDSFEAYFDQLLDFNLYVESLRDTTPKSYRFLVASKTYFLMLQASPFSFFESDRTRFEDVKKFVVLEGSSLWKTVKFVVLPQDVQFLSMNWCDFLRSLSDVSLFNTTSKYLDLKVLVIYRCKNLKTVCSHKMLWVLQNLEVIEVSECNLLEEIITLDEEEEGGSSTILLKFPNLRKMSLLKLPNMKRICVSNAVLVCDSLQQIQVDCPELKRLPLSLPLQEIKEIKVKEEWWNSLEWENPNAKGSLQPYCQFIPSS